MSADLPPAAADAWARLVPRLIESARAGAVVEAQRGVCDHYQRKGWDPGPLAGWVPSPADREALLAAEKLRKSIFSSAPRRQATLAGELLTQVRRVASHATLLEALAQAYLAGHGVGAAPPPATASRGGRGRGRRSRGPARTVPATPAVPRADFHLTSDTIAIYIDEVELGTSHGAIAGIVWNGAEPDHRALPHIGTHRRSPEPLRDLLGCPRAFPFLVPVQGAAGTAERYLPMVRTALQLLLGWLLPLPTRPTRVLVHLERYGGYDPGDDLTPYFAGALDESRVDFPERFAAWRLAQVRWQAKSFGYIPWGDLVGYWYLARVVRGERFGGYDCTRLPGYMPVDGDGYRRIRAASRIVGTPAVEELLDVARDLGGTELGRLVLRSAAPAVAGDVTVQERLLDELERRRRHGADPRRLRPQEEAVRTLVGAVPQEAPLRVRLLAIGLRLGDAAAAALFADLRPRALLLDRELVAQLDHAQAAAEADRFAWPVVAERLERLRGDPAFPYLTPAARSRLVGLHGRVLAVAGRHEEADEAYAAAAALLAEDPGVSAAQRLVIAERLAIWRAMNACDGHLPAAPALLAAALGGEPGAVAVGLATAVGAAVEEQRVRHHLFLRAACFHLSDLDAEDAYLDAYDAWGDLPGQHPGMLIGAYRALLLWRDDADDVCVAAAFREALFGADEPGRGPLQHLTAAAVAVAAWTCIAEADFLAVAERELAAATADGGYAEAAQELRAALAALEALPEDADPEALEEIADRALLALPGSWH